jgi:hypothetical protein
MEDQENYFVSRTLVPVRSEAKDSAEMVTQLLFGDVVALLERDRQWMRIRNHDDDYEGWIDHKMVLPLSAGFTDDLQHWEYVFAPAMAVKWQQPQGELPLHLTLGCRMPVFKEADPTDDFQLELGGDSIRVPRQNLCRYEQAGPADLVNHSARYLGAPYLWGGKSLWGIDCSGFTQICHAVCGKLIPRDASQQVKQGQEIDFNERQPGDLAFFKNKKGKVHHVGIVIDNKLIRHAAGCVHDALLTAEGIFNHQKQLTHELCSIKRIH